MKKFLFIAAFLVATSSLVVAQEAKKAEPAQTEKKDCKKDKKDCKKECKKECTKETKKEEAK